MNTRSAAVSCSLVVISSNKESIGTEKALGIQFLNRMAAINRDDSSTTPAALPPPVEDSQSIMYSKLVR